MRPQFPFIALFSVLVFAAHSAASAEHQSLASGPITLAQADGPMVITPQPDPNRSYARPSSPPPTSPQGTPDPRGGRLPQGESGPGSSYQPYAPPQAETNGTFSVEEIKGADTGFSARFQWISPKLSSTRFTARDGLTVTSSGRKPAAPSSPDCAMAKALSTPRTRAVLQVYWQGPSLGYDFGADGSKTMVLVYDLQSPGEIFNTYAGVDGSAYFIGGVGITFLAHDHVKLAANPFGHRSEARRQCRLSEIYPRADLESVLVWR